MKAITIIPHTTNLELSEIQEPELAASDDIKVKIMQVGICGTDREVVAGGRADAPEGKTRLVIGHEMFGQVLETGDSVTTVMPGDFGMFTVRRGCNECLACLNNRSDLCYTGKYTERGIKGADGFQAAFVIDKEKYFIKIPATLKEVGVLTEPMSVASKAINEAITIQGARFQYIMPSTNWLEGKKALVAGIGPIGLMAAFALRLRGADVIGLDIVEENSLRVQLLQQIGGRYVDGRKVTTTNLDEQCGEADFVFEATGIAQLQVQLIDTLAVNGIYVATGIPAGNRPITILAGELMKQLVLKNQIVLGSVNAGVEHYRMAVADLQASCERWPGIIEQVITEKIPYQHFADALTMHSSEDIKVIVEWA